MMDDRWEMYVNQGIYEDGIYSIIYNADLKIVKAQAIDWSQLATRLSYLSQEHSGSVMSEIKGI
ncbi:hypothetical protein DH09_00690 (plasmid) [Bacillaceae bacterium JMAK1]|nr:hypothetical protein DH09_00690 [Bacillaceae bacterium JMAK1]